MQLDNVYEDAQRAEAYAKLEFPGTYHLAFRDLPEIISEYVKGKRALDYGCGTGRSTRFLRKLGFDVVGVDIAENMIRKARELDPAGNYRLVKDESLNEFKDKIYDLVLAAFTFDNVPTMERKIKLFRELGNLIGRDGIIVNLVSSPEIYMHEWVSFTTKDFPENRHAKNGDRVRIVMNDVEDRRSVEDIIWTDEAYRTVYERAGLELLKTFKPLAKDSEPYPWVNETKIAPWVIYVLRKQ